MANKIVAMFCEGPHDVAFISRILKSVEFKSNESTKIGQYPQPMASLFVNELQKSNMEDLNFQEVRQVLLPANSLQNGESYFFLYSLGGDTKGLSRQRLVKEFLTFVPQPGEISKLPPETILTVVYFFDADKAGIAKRLNYINEELEKITGTKPFEKNGDQKMVNGVTFGCYIFCESESDCGNLEDILVPLLTLNNEPIFEDANLYLKKHYQTGRGKKR